MKKYNSSIRISWTNTVDYPGVGFSGKLLLVRTRDRNRYSYCLYSHKDDSDSTFAHYLTITNADWFVYHKNFSVLGGCRMDVNKSKIHIYGHSKDYGAPHSYGILMKCLRKTDSFKKAALSDILLDKSTALKKAVHLSNTPLDSCLTGISKAPSAYAPWPDDCR